MDRLSPMGRLSLSGSPVVDDLIEPGGRVMDETRQPDVSPADRVFKVVVGGRTVDVLANMEHPQRSPLEALLSVRVSPIAFFVSVPDFDLALPELEAGDYGEDVTVTEVTGTAWHV